jgi:hypothetical protein
VPAYEELWLCFARRTNHYAVKQEENGVFEPLCGSHLLAISSSGWSAADPSLPLCTPCLTAAEKLFRRTHPREHYEPEFMKGYEQD